MQGPFLEEEPMLLRRVSSTTRPVTGRSYDYVLIEVYGREGEEEHTVVEGVYTATTELTTNELEAWIAAHNEAHSAQIVGTWDVLKGNAPVRCHGFHYLCCYFETYVSTTVRKEDAR